MNPKQFIGLPVVIYNPDRIIIGKVIDASIDENEKNLKVEMNLPYGKKWTGKQ